METSNPYESPKSNTVSSSNSTYQPKLLAVNGRIGRLRYLAYGFIATFITVVVLSLLAGILFSVIPEGSFSSSISVGLLGLFYLPLIIISVILMKRRLNDLDKSGWWQLLAFIPIVGFLFAIYVVFWSGTEGSNSYGPQPNENPIGIKIVGLLFPIAIAILGILAAIAIPAYQDYTVRAQQALESN